MEAWFHRSLLGALVVGSLLASGCSGADRGVPAAMAAVRAWITEGELAADPGLSAGHGTVVVLDLEAGSSSQRNTIRYAFERRGVYEFCLDDHDPLLRSALLVDSQGNTAAALDAASRCQTLELPAGAYTLHVHHDGTAVGSGRLAFVQPLQAAPPRRVAALGAAPANPLPFTLGKKWIGDDETNPLEWDPYDALASSVGYHFIFYAPLGISFRPKYASDFHFDSLTGTVFGCGALYWPGTSGGLWRDDCCFLKGAAAGAPPATRDGPYFDLQLTNYCEEGSESGLFKGLSKLRYEIVPRTDNLFAMNLYDAAGAAYHIVQGRHDTLPDSTRMYLRQTTNTSWTSISTKYDEMDLYSFATELPPELIKPADLVPSESVVYDGENCTGRALVLTIHRTSDPNAYHPFDPKTWKSETWWEPLPAIRSVRVAHDTRMTFPYRDPVDGPPTICRNVVPPLEYPIVTTVPTLPILISSNRCSNCDLTGVNLAGTKLDGIDLSSSYLGNVDLTEASLKKANLANAVLSGAKLNHANLEGANLCKTYLNGDPNTAEARSAASLSGAYLKNVNLSGANLSGAIMTFVSFYSSGTPATACETTPCGGTAWPGECATAAGATLTSTQLNDAYLVGVDFSGIRGQGVNFSSSVLAGAMFRQASFGMDPTTSVPANFNQALLHGADFGNAVASDTTFDSAYVDLVGGQHLELTIQGPHDDFTGFCEGRMPCPTPLAGAGSAICVAYGYSAATIPPLVDATTICQTGAPYGTPYCPDRSIVDPSGNCTGTKKPPIVGDCWSGTPRVSMEQSLMGAQFGGKCDPFTGVDPIW